VVEAQEVALRAAPGGGSNPVGPVSPGMDEKKAHDLAVWASIQFFRRKLEETGATLLLRTKFSQFIFRISDIRFAYFSMGSCEAESSRRACGFTLQPVFW
jgi:hypothetical protein